MISILGASMFFSGSNFLHKCRNTTNTSIKFFTRHILKIVLHNANSFSWVGKQGVPLFFHWFHNGEKTLSPFSLCERTAKKFVLYFTIVDDLQHCYLPEILCPFFMRQEGRKLYFFNFLLCSFEDDKDHQNFWYHQLQHFWWCILNGKLEIILWHRITSA
jgi:hypothetical protein